MAFPSYANGTPLSGAPNPLDFAWMETALTLMTYQAPQSLGNLCAAVSPGRVSILPAVAGDAYSACVFDFDAGFQAVVVIGTQTSWQLLLEAIMVLQIKFDNVPGLVGSYYPIDAAFYAGGLHNFMPQNKPVVVCGHSLGGASVVLFAQYIKENKGMRIQAGYTIGAPRPGNPDFAAGVTWPHNRLENWEDIVPSVPPDPAVWKLLIQAIRRGFPVEQTYVPVGSGIQQGVEGDYVLGNHGRSALEIIAGVLSGDLSAHAISEYRRRTLLSAYTAANKIAGAGGYEKPWHIFLSTELDHPSVVPGFQPLPRPSDWGDQVTVQFIDRGGFITSSFALDDPAPSSMTPVTVDDTPPVLDPCNC